jgi:hypothetical protein
MGFKVPTRTHPSVPRPRAPAPAIKKGSPPSSPGHSAKSTFEAAPGNAAGQAAASGTIPLLDDHVGGSRPSSQPSGQQPILIEGKVPEVL